MLMLILKQITMKVLVVHRQDAVLQNIKSQMTHWYLKDYVERP
jgi:hypothetical protein